MEASFLDYLHYKYGYAEKHLPPTLDAMFDLALRDFVVDLKKPISEEEDIAARGWAIFVADNTVDLEEEEEEAEETSEPPRVANASAAAVTTTTPTNLEDNADIVSFDDLADLL